MRNDWPLLKDMFKNFFNEDLNDEKNDLEALHAIVKYYLEHISPYLSDLHRELQRYLEHGNMRTQWKLQEDFKQAFDPSFYGMTAIDFIEMMIEAINAVPEDYFPWIDNLILGGLHQDIDSYGNTLAEWLDAYWEQFDKSDFLKLRSEIKRYVQYYGCDLENAYAQKYGNDFTPTLGSGKTTADLFFDVIVKLIDERIQRTECGTWPTNRAEESYFPLIDNLIFNGFCTATCLHNFDKYPLGSIQEIVEEYVSHEETFRSPLDNAVQAVYSAKKPLPKKLIADRVKILRQEIARYVLFHGENLEDVFARYDSIASFTPAIWNINTTEFLNIVDKVLENMIRRASIDEV